MAGPVNFKTNKRKTYTKFVRDEQSALPLLIFKKKRLSVRQTKRSRCLTHYFIIAQELIFRVELGHLFKKTHITLSLCN